MNSAQFEQAQKLIAAIKNPALMSMCNQEIVEHAAHTLPKDSAFFKYRRRTYDDLHPATQAIVDIVTNDETKHPKKEKTIPELFGLENDRGQAIAEQIRQVFKMVKTTGDLLNYIESSYIHDGEVKYAIMCMGVNKGVMEGGIPSFLGALLKM